MLRYLDILDLAFLIFRIPGWAGDRARRHIRSPKKIFLNDTGLAAALNGLDATALINDRNHILAVYLESFVVGEIRRRRHGAKNERHSIITVRIMVPKWIFCLKQATNAASALRSKHPPRLGIMTFERFYSWRMKDSSNAESFVHPVTPLCRCVNMCISFRSLTYGRNALATPNKESA